MDDPAWPSADEQEAEAERVRCVTREWFDRWWRQQQEARRPCQD